MKKIFFCFLFCLSQTLHAQNPDGKNASLHITPSWLWGKANYNRATSIWYPESMSSPSQNIATKDVGTLQYPFAFGIHVMLKIPTASFLTMSVSYSFNQRFEQLDKVVQESPYFSQYWWTNGNTHQISFTASIYNLFSIYQE